MKHILLLWVLGLIASTATLIRAQTDSESKGDDDTIHYHVGRHDSAATPAPSTDPVNSGSTNATPAAPPAADQASPDTTPKSTGSSGTTATTPTPSTKEPAIASQMEFQADITTQTQGVSFDAHISVDGSNVRSDVTMMGMQTSVVVNSQEKQFFQLLPQTNTLIKLPWSEGIAKALSPSSLSDSTWTRLPNPETVSGVICDVWTVQDPTGKIMKVDINSQTGDPVKVYSEDGGMTVNWKNYKAGPINPEIFKKPSDYNEVDPPDSMKNFDPGQFGMKLW